MSTEHEQHKPHHHHSQKPFFARTWVLVTLAVIFICLLLYFVYTEEILDMFFGVANE